MARNTTTFLELKQLFNQSIGDDLEFDTTTNITTNNSILSTTLNQFDDGEDDHFNTWWVYITEGVNITKSRKISDYATSGGTLTVYGAALAAESAAVTCRLTRYNPDHAKQALIRACEEIYPTLHKPMDDHTLITGNMLPDASFESDLVTDFYSVSNITYAKTSTEGLYRGRMGQASAKATATAANGYIYLTSDAYPRLLDLQGKTVDAYVWVYPEVANDAYLEIYTKSDDGTTTQTLTSTTTCAAAVWTLLKLEDQALNDDLDEIQVRFKVATNTKYVYFDDAYVGCERLKEYILPDYIIEGHLSRVFVQDYGYSDPAMYDINPFITAHSGIEYPFDITDDGVYTYLVLLGSTPPTKRRIRMLGYQPLEILSTDATTLTLDTQRVPLLIAKAREIFFSRESVPVSAEDTSRFQGEYARAVYDYNKLFYKARMSKPVELVKI